MSKIEKGQLWLTRAGLTAIVIGVNEAGPAMPVKYIVRDEPFANLVFMDGRDSQEHISNTDLVELVKSTTTVDERQKYAGTYIAKWGDPFTN